MIRFFPVFLSHSLCHIVQYSGPKSGVASPWGRGHASPKKRSANFYTTVSYLV